MGASYISMGITVEREITLTRDETEAIVREHLPAMKDRILQIDPSGRFEDLDADEQEIVDTITAGLMWLREGEEHDSWKIPGHGNLAFVTSGGMSWGDSPFEEFDAVVIAGDAAEALPDFGRKVGVLGGGIRLEYGDTAGDADERTSA